MACLSSSPPPMMPEDDEEEDDSSFAEGFADLSESDNVPYDLTGLSDKLHSIPKEAIHVTPKEFSRPDTENNVVIRLNGLGVPQPDTNDVISNYCEVMQGVPDFSDDFPDLEEDLPGTIPDFDSDSQNNDDLTREVAQIDKNGSNCDLKLDEQISEADLELSDDKSDSLEHTVDLPEEFQNFAQNLTDFDKNLIEQTDFGIHLTKPQILEINLSERTSPTIDGETTLHSVDNSSPNNFELEKMAGDFESECAELTSNVDFKNQSTDKNLTLSFNDNLTTETFSTNFAEKVAESSSFQVSFSEKGCDGEESFGDFAQTSVEEVEQSAFSVSFPDNLPTKSDESFGDFADFETNWAHPQEQGSLTTFVAVANVSDHVLHLDDDDDDDDFGDFDSANFSASHHATQSLVPLQSIISLMRPKIPTVISDLFSPLDNDCDKVDDELDSTKILNPSSNTDDRVWDKIHEIETTPALGMTWNKTSSQNCLMKLLKIDPRNIVLEPKPRKYSPGNVPAFAMGLSTSSVLQPTMTSSTILQPTTGVLQPSKVAESSSIPAESKRAQLKQKETESSSSESVPPVVFDWQNSGLKNPLELNGQQPPSASEQNLKPQPVLDDKTRATEASTSIKTNGLHPPSRISPAASPAKPRTPFLFTPKVHILDMKSQKIYKVQSTSEYWMLNTGTFNEPDYFSFLYSNGPDLE